MSHRAHRASKKKARRKKACQAKRAPQTAVAAQASPHCTAVMDLRGMDASECLLELAPLGVEASVYRLLIAAGADIDAVGRHGKTALMWGAGFGQYDVCRLLLEAGADVNSRDASGVAAMHFAGGVGSDDVLQLLIEAGADIDARDDGGGTPLHWAAYYGEGGACRVLIAAGAKLDPVNNNGDTPRDVAQGSAVEALLREHAKTSGAALEVGTAQVTGKAPVRRF